MKTFYSPHSKVMQQLHGNKMEERKEEIEKEVRKLYEGIEISHPSLTADSERKFSAGSPDGIGILENEKFLLEYKAPYSLFEEENYAVDAHFLCNKDDGISLSKSLTTFVRSRALMIYFSCHIAS